MRSISCSTDVQLLAARPDQLRSIIDCDRFITTLRNIRPRAAVSKHWILAQNVTRNRISFRLSESASHPPPTKDAKTWLPQKFPISRESCFWQKKMFHSPGTKSHYHSGVNTWNPIDNKHFTIITNINMASSNLQLPDLVTILEGCKYPFCDNFDSNLCRNPLP